MACPEQGRVRDVVRRVGRTSLEPFIGVARMLKSVVQSFVVGASRDTAATERVTIAGNDYRMPSESAAERLLARASIAALGGLALSRPARPSLTFAAPIAETLASDVPAIGARTSYLL